VRFGGYWGIYSGGGDLPVRYPRLKVGKGVCLRRLVRLVPM